MEYGRIVGQSSGHRWCRGGGTGDVTGQVMDAISDAIDQVASLPPEVLVAGAVLALIALVFFRR